MMMIDSDDYYRWQIVEPHLNLLIVTFLDCVVGGYWVVLLIGVGGVEPSWIGQARLWAIWMGGANCITLLIVEPQLVIEFTPVIGGCCWAEVIDWKPQWCDVEWCC